MTMLAERVDAVIGVDTHKHTHTAAVVTTTGGLVDHVTIPTDAFGPSGYSPSPAARPRSAVWAIEAPGATARTHDVPARSGLSGSSRSIAPDGRPARTAPSPTSSTRSEPRARPSAVSTWPSRASV